MRILVASASYPTPAHPDFLGGAETFAVQLCEALARRGHAVLVVRSGPVLGKPWAREAVNGVDVVTLPTRNLYSPWQGRSSNAYVRAAWHLVEDRWPAPPGFDRVLRDFRPDVLHTNNLYGLTTGVWAKAKARQVPVVHTLHDYYLTCARSTRFKDDARCRTTCTACSCLTRGRRRASTAVDTVVGVSERILAIHRKCGLFNGGAEREIIRNPPPAPRKTVSPVSRDGKIVFGFIGRPSVEKGIFELLAAFRKLPRGAARLVVAGAAEKEIQARMIAGAGDSEVEFLGFVRPEAFFEKIDVTIAPSVWDDPCPMVIGESFAYARPVIGARRGGIPELVADERSGWLYTPTTVELEKLLLSIVNDKNSVAAKSEYLYSRPEPRDFDDLVSEYISVYSRSASKGERSRR